MARLTIKGEQQIQASLLSQILAGSDLNDITPGSVLDLLTAAIAKEKFAQYVQIAKGVGQVDLNNLSEEELAKKEFELGITPRAAAKATGLITISRGTGFEKVSTPVYDELPAPSIGDTTIYVEDASSELFGAEGSLIIGRGTNNEEEVTYSAAPTDEGTYYSIVVSALTKNHTHQSTVILKQGENEVIPAKTVIRIPANTSNSEIVFFTQNEEVLLAGEAELSEVFVEAAVAGTGGNIFAEAIIGTSAFRSPPFAGAEATNPVSFCTGADAATLEERREAIRTHLSTLSGGVRQAILNALVGQVDTETQRRIQSVSVVSPQTSGEAALVYLDDGFGFVPQTEVQQHEVLVASARGGEQRVTTHFKHLAPPTIESGNAEPFNLRTEGIMLSYEVRAGRDLYLDEYLVANREIHRFLAASFEDPEAATAAEVARAINSSSNLVNAISTEAGKVIITPKNGSDENIRISIAGFDFPAEEQMTIRLYKNGTLLAKDGEYAWVEMGTDGPYDVRGEAYGTPYWMPARVKFTIDTKQTFDIELDPDQFDDPAVATPQEMVDFFNSVGVGFAAELTADGARFRLLSTAGRTSIGRIELVGVPSYLPYFTVDAGVGRARDYTINPELGQIVLTTPLAAGDVLEAGDEDGEPAYQYYTGLTRLALRILYGDDANPELFPGVGALGAHFKVLAPTTTYQPLSLTIYMQPLYSYVAARNPILSKITQYVNTLKIGEALILERVRALALSVPGVLDVEVDSPSANIVPTTTEVLKTRESLISLTQGT